MGKPDGCVQFLFVVEIDGRVPDNWFAVGCSPHLGEAQDALGEACHLLPTTYCSQAVDCVLLTAYCLLLIASRRSVVSRLLTAYCLLRIASRAASSVDCLLLIDSYLLLS